MSKTKRSSLLLLSAAMLLTALVAMSLPNLHLLPGESFSLGAPPTGTGLANAPLTDWARSFGCFAASSPSP